VQKFFPSGIAFMLVALLCFATGLIATSRTVWVSIGGVWLIVAIITRRKNAATPPAERP